MRVSWKHCRPFYVPTFVLLCFLAAFFWGLNESFPLFGHDFNYFFPRLLAGKWHFLAQGFFPFRWAPQLCGGFPVYGNPHDVFYSLPQVLSLFLDLWTAVEWSIAIALIVGYVGWFRFGRDVLRLPGEWSHVLGLVILANGYYFMHMIVGHVSYHTLPLMGWFLWFLFDRNIHDNRAVLLRSAAIALLGAYVLYSAGYFVLLLTGLVFLFYLPVDILFNVADARVRLKQIAVRTVTYGAAMLLLMQSKLVAVYSLMRFLPRSTVFDSFADESSGFLFIIKSFFMLPQGAYLFSDGVDKWGIHEYSMFVSPLVFVGCIIGIWQWATDRWHTEQKKGLWLAAYILFFTLFFIQLAVGYGVLVDWLQYVPIFSSLRVTARYLYVPGVLLSIGSVCVLSRISFKNYQSSFVVLIAGGMTVVSFLAAYIPLLREQSLLLTVPYTDVLKQIETSHYLTQPVSNVMLLPDVMPSDMQALFAASTSPGCYEPLLIGTTFRAPLEEGATDRIKDGSFNLYNPACMQYPEENNCSPGDTIAATDDENFTRFINGMSDTWHLSIAQRIADIASLIALLVAIGTCLWITVLRRISWRIVIDKNRVSRQHLPMDIRSRLSHLFIRFKQVILQRSSGPTDGFRVFLMVVLSAIGLAFIAYICAFKLLDRDFWWHITAGKLMVQTGTLITAEPFSYVRFGMPYLANHEWLAQIILYLLHAAGGSTAIILFRTGIMMLSLGILLQLDRKNFWFLMPVAILAANSIRGAFIERPQLFTFLIFSCLLFLTFHILGKTEKKPLSKLQRRNFLIGFAVLQVLWVNVHGGASLLALLFPGVLFLEYAFRWLRAKPENRSALEKELRWFMLLGVVLIVGLFCSPITYENLTYLWKLMNDRTIIYIQEWQPDKIDLYLKNVGPFWLLAAGAIAAGRKNVVASTLLVLITGYLSIKALRHGPLFVLSACAVIVYQLQNSLGAERMRTWLLERRIVAIAVSVVVMMGLANYVHAQYGAFVRPDQLAGYGTFEFGKGAADFLDKNEIQGKMFNSYGIGGYLIHRNRKVFIDGRNVDYGFQYMNETYLAGIDPVQWQKLEKKYGFTYAVIDYFSNKDKKKNILMYTQFLENNPDWSLVYFDDWTAVFLKNVPENKNAIDRLAFQNFTVSSVEFGTVMNNLGAEKIPALETELRRAIADSPASIKARIVLAKLLIRAGRLDEAQVVAQDAAIAVPGSPEPHALFAAIYIVQKNWDLAAGELDKALKLAGKDYPDLDYGLVAQVFLQAGRVREAKMYARKAGLTITEREEEKTQENANGSGAVMMPETKSGTGGAVPMVNPAQDAIDFQDKALAFAQAGKNAEARENFLISLKLNPSSAQGWNNLGTLSFFENKLDEAKTQYERAIEEDPKYADPYYNLALLLAKQGDLKNARIRANEAAALGKDIAPLKEILK